MDALEGYRKRIDEIDSEITRLFEERMDVVLKVAEYKRKNNLEIFHKGREEVVIKKNIDRLKNKDYEREIEKFYNSLMEVSRELQGRKLNREKENLDIKEFKINEEDIIGFQGVLGSFSEEALIEYFGENTKSKSYETFEDVFKGIDKGEIKYGILPVENSCTGGISEVHDLLIKYDFHIVGEESIKISHNLLGVKGSSLKDIKEVYSHAQGFSQSSDFLKEHKDLLLIQFKNTAISAKKVMDSKDKTLSAIASKRAADIYNLDILKEGINNLDSNKTRFIIVAKELLKSKDSNKVSVVFSLEDKPGTLYKLLKYFSENNINMSRIESRPTKNEAWKYYLYIDFEGGLYNFGVLKAIDLIKLNSQYFKLLGWYKKGI
ncbi:chorismate mutase [Clostridium sp. LY3-2]|uniref:chorismate mutase n=1 Tax=Clostridium sp. LY3-2 TaxID=2942482 RepID=UPI0021529143|nr:chorismate mutase [Clostridium sp. LY3-2]MCR6516416.1 chorismate mutase [Clostridium sp. LY3-2]